MWTKQKQTLEKEFRNHGRKAHVQGANIYGVTTKLKTYLLLFT
jgi:hypothetical protein